MSDPEYNAVWPGTYGHFVTKGRQLDTSADETYHPEPSWEDIVLEQAIEETMLARAERKIGGIHDLRRSR